jgi:hypothetical protein
MDTKNFLTNEFLLAKPQKTTQKTTQKKMDIEAGMSQQEMLDVWEARVDRLLEDFTTQVSISLQKRETSNKSY